VSVDESDLAARDAPVRVLHVDDDPAILELAAAQLARATTRLRVTTATSVESALAHLETETVDCVVSDHEMPEETGLEFLTRLRATGCDVPFILFTGEGSEEIASRAISAGVTDYLQKGLGTDQFLVLANRVENAVDHHRAARDLERRSRQHEAVADLSGAALEGELLDRLFERAAETVSDRLGTEYAAVLERSPDGETLSVVAATGWGEDVPAPSTVEIDADSPAAYALSVSEPVVVTDLGSDERFRTRGLLGDHDVRSGVGVVVGSTEDPWGLFGTYARRPRVFTDDDVTFVRNVANVLATVIERRRAEERLRESETRYREIVELSPDTVFRLDTNGEFLYVSPAVEELVGHAPDEFRGATFGEYVAAGSFETALDGFTRVRDGEVVRQLELTLTRADASSVAVEVSASPVVDDDGAVVAVQGFVRDITARKRREHELRGNVQRYRTVVEMSPDPIFVHVDGDVVYANRAAVGLVGTEARADLLGTPLAQYVRRGERAEFARRLELTQREGLTPTNDPYAVRSLNGDVRHVEVTSRAIEYEGAAAVLTMVSDVTDRHRYERTLTTLHERTHELSRTKRRETVTALAVETVTELIDCDAAVVYEFDGSDALVPHAPHGARSRAEDERDGERGGDPDLDPDRAAAAPDGRVTRGVLWDVFVAGERRVVDEPGVVEGVRSALVLPLSNHGVLLIGDDESRSFTRAEVELASLIRDDLDAALDRTERERRLRERDRELRRRNEQLEQLDRLNTIIRETTRAAIQAPSRKGIQRRVCERLASAAEYSFAWIGAVDEGDGTLRVGASAEMDPEYVDYLRSSEPATPIHDLVATATREGSVAVARDLLEDAEWRDLREHALSQGYRSVAVVPVVIGANVDCVLAIHAKAGDIFDERERTILEELGYTIGYALQNAERADGLRAAERTEIEVRIRDEWLFSNRIGALGVDADLAGLIPGEEGTLRMFLRLTGSTPDAVADGLRDLESVVDVQPLSVDDDCGLYQVTVSTPRLLAILGRNDARLATLTVENGETTVTAVLRDDASVRSTVEEIRAAYPETELRARRRHAESVDTRETFRDSVVDQLTEKQFDALRTALYGGFYEWPRESTSEALAATRDIAASTFQYHLRAAERAVVTALIDPQ
jgi:PAS domain S-box-containing protein